MKKLLFLILVLFSQYSVSQTVQLFSEGYNLPLELRYGREALVQDRMVYQLATGKFVYPSKENMVFGTPGEEIKWIPVSGDSTGVFKGDNLDGGYLYLPYVSGRNVTALLNVTGHSMLYFNGEPHTGDGYGLGYINVPVSLRKGINHIMIRCSRSIRRQGVKAQLIFPEKQVMLSTDDPTLPFVVAGEVSGRMTGAVVVINSTNRFLNDLEIISTIEGKQVSSKAPSIPPLSIRKVPFVFDAANISKEGKYNCSISLKEKSKTLDEKVLQVESVQKGASFSSTFISNIDGSVQYYGVTPQTGGIREGSSLFLSVHGAGVEAIGQARAYDAKEWGTLVAPTNRRSRGFDWEDWGRLDALEVLGVVQDKYKPDPERIYLTGHSMGGHGTWYLGSTYPGKWAAIAPCAGYPNLKMYASGMGRIQKDTTSAEKILNQAGNPGDVLALSKNLGASGIYVHHGDSDRTVSVRFARQMREILGKFHNDFSYNEYPGGSHWWGDGSVDWPPLFDYFRWHTIKKNSKVYSIDFTTASPAISSVYYWVQIIQQQHSFRYSHINVTRDPEHKTISGSTSNIATLSFSTDMFRMNDTIKILLDGGPAISIRNDGNPVYLKRNGSWSVGAKPDPDLKGVNRNGSFKEPFNNNMVFVYGTSGTAEESQSNFRKARYDAEVWYYRGNGAVDIVPDSKFDAAKYPDRGVVIYGNASDNSAWSQLLAGCPVQVKRGIITAGDRTFSGENLAAYFIWPRKDSFKASVAVIAGTGPAGMRAAEANQYFISGSGYPDFMIFSADMLKDGAKGILGAGFYDNEWKIDQENSAF